MTPKFILSCESTLDIPYSYIEKRGLPVLFYNYTVDGTQYIDDMGRDPNALPNFYDMLKNGKLPNTTQLNPQQYYDYLEKVSEKGDVLHIAFSSGLSGSVNSAYIALDMLKEAYPERKIVVIDSTCASSGLGLLVDEIADMRDRGCSIDEAEKWARENLCRIHSQFFTTDMKFLRRSGRVSGAAAAVATVLNICPIMHLNRAGKIIAYSKVRGKKKAIDMTVSEMLTHAENGADYGKKCFISHSDCIETAKEVQQAIENSFPKLAGKVRIYDIGTIIASHTGPGTVAVFFFGDERQ
ncbi:MAG: DegV family protein [Clostridia bacterium]|nr:DegV family protein [Clostridia bacterium]